jgi:tetratricopeptide (TPR) repeat protein
MTMKRTILVISLVLMAAFVLSAQDFKGKGRQGGYVLDEQGAPIEGVRVKLFSVKAGEGFEVVTDKDGRWMAAWIRGGSWHVDFEKIGYGVHRISVNVAESQKNPEIKTILKKIQGIVLTDEIKVLLTKGNQLFEQKSYPEAQAVYQEILTKFPDAYPIYLSMANCYFAQEKYDLAEQTYMKVLDKDPKNTQALISIGNCYANRNDNAKAQEWYAKVDFDKIDDPVVLYNLGANYYNTGKFEEALKCYLKAVELQKDFADARFQLGLAYLNLQKNVEAIATFEEFLKMFPDSEKAPQVRGFLEYLRKK